MPVSLPLFSGLLNSQKRRKNNQELTKILQCMYTEKLNYIISERAGKNPLKNGSEYTRYLVV